jgi:hypothetical protein
VTVHEDRGGRPPVREESVVVHQLVTDQGVIRISPDGILEFFRDLDGRSSNRVLLWGCDAVVDGPDDTGQVTLTITRKRLPVVSVGLPVEERAEAEAVAAVVRARARGT